MNALSLPKRVTLELTNRCNRACPECPRHKMRYSIGDMPLSIFTRIIDQLPDDTTIVPFFRGESLVHPQFADAMHQLHRFSTVQLATNGDALNASNINAIIASCSFVSLSLHDFGLNHDATEWLMAAENAGVTTQVSILATQIPNGQKQVFIDTWLQWVNRVRIYMEHSHRGFGDTALNLKCLDQPCPKPFEEMAVYWDGKAALCNHDWDNGYPLGDLTTQTVEHVWHSHAYEDVRNLHNDGGRCRIDACKACDYWMVPQLPNHMFGELYTN